MMIRKLAFAGLSLAASSLLLVGCPAPEEDDDERTFAEIAPRAEQVRLSAPSGASPGAGTASLYPSVDLARDGDPALSTFYTFTRQTFDYVNLGTAWILGLVTTIVRYPVTQRTTSEATWGPWKGELSAAEWRLRVTRGEDSLYSYVLEGRRVGQESYRAVVTGQGYPRGDARRGLGSFVVDHDAADAIDPARLRGADESGTTRVDHDLRSLREDLRGAYTIGVEGRPTATAGRFDVALTRLDGGGGTVDIVSKGDIDADPAKRAFEDLTMRSRWVTSGAGRADVTVSRGDVPASVGTVVVTECWSPNFQQSYYTDSAGLAPTTGEEALCP